MTASISIGTDHHGKDVLVDVEELLATRLLVQGNSGSGKSHLLRRLLEESAAMVQQVVIDPEGDFVTLADEYGHVVIDAGDYNEREIVTMATRIREHRASVVLSLDSLELEAQMKCAATFLSTLFDAPRDHWYPALVVVDEAQMFAPVAAGDVSDEARRLSLAAMTNLMCRGRKRGLAGVIATQRLAKLAKNVAAEASNFLMGRTFLDIDMARAADLLGMERRQAEQIRDLERGRFLGLGPAIARRPVNVKIGAVRTGTRGGAHKLMPPPVAVHSAWLTWVSDPVVALLVATLVALPLLFGRRITDSRIQGAIWTEAMTPAGGIILAIGAGGALKQVLVTAGLSDLLVRIADGGAISPLLLAWGVSVCIRLATGSATVATITTAGVMQGLVTASGVEPEWMVLAIGAGSLFFSHVNDPGFWLVKSYLGTDMPGTFKTWSIMETVVAVVGLLLVMLASSIF